MYDPRFIALLEEAVGAENAATALAAFGEEASVSIRLNPWKRTLFSEGTGPQSDATADPAPPAGAVPLPWSPCGYLLGERPSFTLDPLFHAGAYYVQDSSAMFVGALFRSLVHAREDRPLRVLDLCAAPGGKTTDLAASLRALCGDRFLLVANEVMAARAAVLRENVARWGDPCVVVTSADPAAFASLGGWFDLILADVPCSGEGMFRKDAEAIAAWSEAAVALCEARARRIVADVWPALAEGGLLLYATCTFNRRENDGNVAWIARELGAEILPPLPASVLPAPTAPTVMPGPTVLPAPTAPTVMPGPTAPTVMPGPTGHLLPTDHGTLLLPGLVPGEGQFAAALRKTVPAPPCRTARPGREVPPPQLPGGLLEGEYRVRMHGPLAVAVPAAITAEVETVRSLRPLSAGVALGELKGCDFVPSADLALCIALGKEAYPRRSVDRETSLQYLHRDALVLPDAPRGYVLLEYEGVPLGFVKNLGSRCNNLLPPGRRIRMDIG